MFGPQIMAQGANFQEILKEVFGMVGYRDGMRFIKQGFDPHVAMLQQQVQELQNKGKDGAQPQPPDTTRVQAAQIQGQFRLQERQMEAQQQDKENASELQIAKIKANSDMARQQVKQSHDLMKVQMDQQHQAQMAHMQHNLSMFAAAAQPQPTHTAPARVQ